MKKEAFIALAALIMSTLTPLVSRAETLPYQNTSLPVSERVEDLLGRLTLQQKIQLMQNASPAIPELGIPEFEWWSEALHGVGRNGFTTVFPITMAMAASWDDALLQSVFTAVSDEARAKNSEAKARGKVQRYQCLSFWTPNINIFRDPRWGRGQETYGEDPYLTSTMGLAVVRGLQGPDDAKHRKLLACAKHFAVHSGPEWSRHTFNIEDLPERDLWETYLPAFKTLVQEGHVAEVMCAYQRIDGDPCCGSSRYEQQILRDEWGFDGLVVSDCGAITDFYKEGRHGVSRTAIDASAKAVLAGTDVECGSNYRHLGKAVRQGLITEEQIDVSVRRLLTARFELGDLDPDDEVEWTKIPSSVICSDEHRQLALDMAREGIVLLENDGDILPLSRSESIVVMGPNAKDSVMMWGNYNGFPISTTTILQGIEQKAGAVKYVGGCGLTRREVSESRMADIIAPDGKAGLKATYWNNTDKEGDAAAHAYMTSPINLTNGGATVFAPGVNLENFSALYEGTYTATADERLVLTLQCDDKAVLTVNGDTLIAVEKRSDRLGYSSVELDVQKGNTYALALHYVQKDDMATLQFDVASKVTYTDEQLLAEIGDAATVIFVGGISPRLEGEEMKVSEPGFKGGDRETMELPQVQRDILAMLHKAGKRVIFINCSGSAMGLVPESENCDAIVQAWYAGEAGGRAVADVLYGDYNPSGKLPVTFYRSIDDLPDFEDYTMKGRTYRYFSGEALYPFGYGLSYTSFTISAPEYDAAAGTVSVTVENTGERDGDEVVQVYIRNTSDADGPIKTLKAFRRVSVGAGQKESVTIDFPRENFEVWDASTGTMRVVPGKYELMAGSSSRASDLKTTVVKVK